jgi:hypothetical protein
MGSHADYIACIPEDGSIHKCHCLETSYCFSLLRSASNYFAMIVAPFEDFGALNYNGHGELLCLFFFDCSLVCGSQLYAQL